MTAINMTVTSKPTADQILEDAMGIIAQRGETYGSVEQNWQNIADIWNVMLQDKLKSEHQLSAADVGMLNIGQKLARLKATPDHADSITDVCGYAALLVEVV